MGKTWDNWFHALHVLLMATGAGAATHPPHHGSFIGDFNSSSRTFLRVVLIDACTVALPQKWPLKVDRDALPVAGRAKSLFRRFTTAVHAG